MKPGLLATIMWLMSMGSLKVTYNYKGRPENSTLNEGVADRKIAG